MRRLELCRYGPAELAVRFADVPIPALSDHEVLIKVSAAAINPIDLKLVNGDLRRIMTLELPAPIGFDACGHIESIGSGVTGFEPGERIFARAPRQKMGSFAEYLAIDAKYIARAPKQLSALQAASIPLVALTTVQALVDRAHAQPGQRILIHAGSGGLGSFAVQYAKHVLGLHVTTTTSSKNVEWVRALGADVVIAYDREDYKATRARYDIVFDTLGGATTHESFGVLERGGTVVSVAGPPDWKLAQQIAAGPLLSAILWCIALPMQSRARLKRGRYFRFLTESDGAQLVAIATLCDAGLVHPVIDSVYPFEHSIEALLHLAQGRAKGKVVIDFMPAPGSSV